MEAPIKRGRGRPRKINIPEEVIITNNSADLSDLKNINAPEIVQAGPEIAEEEVIHLVGDSSHEEEEPEVVANVPVPEVVPEPVPAVAIEPKIVYMPAPPPVVDPSIEKARRNSALTKIKRYRESFEAVRAMRFSEEWSTDALESHLEDVRIMISSKTTGLLVKSAYTMGVKGIEVGTCAIGMKTYGLADLLSKNAEIDSILKEIQCELGVGTIPPGHRLMLATISTVFVLDSVNKRAEVLGSFKQEPVNETISSKYSDL